MYLKPIAILAAALFLVACNQGGKSVSISDQQDKLSYTVGVRIGQGLKRDEIDVDPEVLAQAIRDVQAGGELAMTAQDMQEAMRAHQQGQIEKRNAQAEENKKAGEKFLAENKEKEGVVTLPSGLQYKVIKEGTGKSPTATDTVVAHYTGTLIDGTEFDSSHKRGQPATFPVQGVIKGWQEAVQKMKVGAEWQVFIPAELGYGERGAGSIGPNAALIFVVELLEIKEPAKNTGKPAGKKSKN